MKKIKLTLLFFVAVSLLLTACGKKDENSIVEQEPEITYDWRTCEWSTPQIITSDYRLYVGEYTEIEKPQEGSTYIKEITTANGMFYLSSEQTDLEEKIEYYFSMYFNDATEAACLDLNEALESELAQGYQVNTFAVAGSSEYLFLCDRYEENKLTGLRVVHLDANSKRTKEVDLYESFVQSGFWNVEKLNEWGKLSLMLKYDKNGLYYLYIWNKAYRVLVLGSDGNIDGIMDVCKEAAESNIALEVLQDPDGNLLFFLNSANEKQNYCFCYDLVQKKVKVICPFGQVTSRFCFNEKGICYFWIDNNLYRWKVGTGQTDMVFDANKEGITENAISSLLSLNQEGFPVIYVRTTTGYERYSLTDQKPSEEGYMKVASLIGPNKELQGAAADYTRKNPSDGISVEISQDGDADAYRTRVIAEMVAGKGPDALFVSASDMEILYEKDLLEDLSDSILEDTKKNVFQGILDSGRIDGKQVGFPLKAELHTLLVHKDVWNKEGWTLQDVLDLVEQAEDDSLKVIVDISGGARYGYGFYGNMQALVLEDLANTPFLNMQEKTCNFDSPEFIHLLELCEKYGEIYFSGNEWEWETRLKEGTVLANIGDVTNIQTFSETMFRLGEECICVGFPVESGSGCYWDCGNYLVLRKGSLKKETMSKFIEFVYGKSRQRTSSTPVRSDIFRDYLVYTDYGTAEGYASLNIGNGSYRPIRIKADGTAWVEEYIELAEKAQPYPRQVEMITKIVLEELEAFYTGKKDAETVAKIIQNRVQLFLAENDF